ncbi:SAV_915 family protein [Saccharopolyspora rosea]|uniref:SAV_915 family protein n=1 Tax=Saccharopolyspora rosea TaxID=524884 RepID=A0ABW3FKZ9_9PSEU|nr:SAV_915 family protein [Saccharopolyspora rosea]
MPEDTFGADTTGPSAPDVISPEHLDRDDAEADLDPADWPAEVYVPCEPITSVDPQQPHQQVRVELRRTTDGALALLTYTSLERLVEGCGQQQAWISVPGNAVRKLAEDTEAEVILQDVPLPESELQTGEE